MPTYVCTSVRGHLSAAKKQEIAQEITRIHCDATQAPGYFAQVVFEDVEPGNYYIGGEPLCHGHVFVHGRTRAGRSAQLKTQMVRDLARELGRIAGLPPTGVWVYVSELPSRQFIEGGHVLPEPGDEAAWTAALPPEDRAWMQAIGAS